MNFLKKFNRGVLLLILLLLGAIIYLVISGIIQSGDKKEIVKVCQDYIQTEVTYSMLPEEYRQDGTQMGEEAYQEFTDEMQAEIKSFYVDNEDSYQPKITELGLNILYMNMGQTTVTQYEKQVIKFTDITFNGDKVTLTANCLTNYNGEQNTTEDYLALQKVDGKWKITSAELITVPETTNSYY